MSDPGERVTISVVVPIYNEEETLDRLLERLVPALDGIGEPWEALFVNDGSVDASEKMLRAFHEKDPRLKVLNFSRNFGHQVAVTCGLDYAIGDAVIVMDGDLQDPPEILAGMVARWREGYEVVYAIRQQRKENIFLRAGYRSFYWLLNRVSYLDIPLDSGDFSLMDRRVVDVLGQMPERNRFVRGLRTWTGFRQIGYEYAREARYAGYSKYGLSKLLRLAFDGLISYSYVPLRLVSNVGLLVSMTALGYMAYLVFMRVLGNQTIEGWVSTVVIMLFLGGIQLLSLGVIGE
ncbi:MAG: glycosyltransferase involved in cell wall biosynthesis, partial [Candidatus Binatia bacterium]